MKCNQLARLFTVILVIVFLNVFSVHCTVVRAQENTPNINNVQTISVNGQSCSLFFREIDVIGFYVAIGNTGPLEISGIILVSVLDFNRVPILWLSQSISVEAGETSWVRMFSDRIPRSAFVGIATAYVNLVNPTTYVALCPSQSLKFNIGFIKDSSKTISYILVTPTASSLSAGKSISYFATAHNANGDSWNVTSLVNWSVSDNAGGSWSGNKYTSNQPGNWLVTAKYSEVQGVAQLKVYPSMDINHDWVVNIEDVYFLKSAYFSFQHKGILDRTCDLNSDGRISFQDIQLFVASYVRGR